MDGSEWQAEADRRWAAATRPEDYVAPPLPDFGAAAPAFVTREVLGSILVDRAGNLAHRVETATEECGLDGIREATFYHFDHELPAETPRCERCFAD